LEITLYTSSTRSAVCCLSSVNLELYDEWKDTQMVADIVRLLDNVLEYFIRLAPPELSRAVNSASQERAIGLGAMGFHSYLQKNDIPFESGGFNSSIQHTHKLYSDIRTKAIVESKRLAESRGEPSDLTGSGMRNSHLMAPAPNASSSSIVDCSPANEPWAANAFNAQGRAGSYLIKNKYLSKVLDELGKNTKDIWASIISAGGSVQHLTFLTDHQKLVFKTFFEIDQAYVIENAAVRQPLICQSQSINLAFAPGTTRQQFSDIHMMAWAKGLKSLYYCRSDSKIAVTTGKQVDVNECVSCQG